MECIYRGALAGCHASNCPVHGEVKSLSDLQARRYWGAVGTWGIVGPFSRRHREAARKYDEEEYLKGQA